MSIQASTRKQGYVSGDFLTPTYRISGEVALRGDPLLDQLNDHMAQFLTVERMFVSLLHDPASLIGNFSLGQVRKASLALVILKEQEDGLPHRRGQYLGRDHADRDMLVVTGGFEVRGKLRLHRSVNVIEFLRTTPEQFVPFFDATAVVASRREIVFQGGAVLVNRLLIEVFCPVEG
jgi:hypothetical protein